MKRLHTPQVNARYWTAITLASVFGTNMGDLYAHSSGLGIPKGLAVLAVLTALVFLAEHRDQRRHEAYYWLVIVLIRTAATNIADFLAYRVRVPELILTASLLALIAIFGWSTRRNSSLPSPSLPSSSIPSSSIPSSSLPSPSQHAVPNTTAAYWLAMLSAGVFGTVVGDICEHRFGDGVSAIALSAILLVVLFAGRGRAATILALYWATVTVARTAGTAIGDWLAENKAVPVGLPLSTLLSGLAILAVLILWRSSATAAPDRNTLA